jgi:hypothetical protein
LLIADIIPVAILTGFHWPAMILRPRGENPLTMHLLMDEHFELKLVERKGEIDVATYESPKFQDLLTKAEGQGTYPMIALLEQQFYNLQSLLDVSVAATVLALYDWRIFGLGTTR